jgi:hypothetical protein
MKPIISSHSAMLGNFAVNDSFKAILSPPYYILDN